MRAILFTEELMGVALKFSKKSSSIGSLWVWWEPAISNSSTLAPDSSSKIIANRKPSSSFHRRIQTGISLCFATLLFTALVFFLVCALDSSFAIKNFNHPSSSPSPFSSSSSSSSSSRRQSRAAAMQGMGTIFRPGTRSMSEIVIAHVEEDLPSQELRLFLRNLLRSGLSARADVVLLFPGDPRAPGYAAVVEEEIENFNNLLLQSGCSISNASTSSRIANGSMALGPSCRRGSLLLSNSSLSPLNLEAFARAEEEGRARAEWALARALKNSSTPGLSEQEIEEWIQRRAGNWIPPLGSIMGFDVAELEPLDTLSGFIDRPPIQLRRWLCYQMLLGMARQHQRYRQVMIAQAKGVFLLGDSLLAIARRRKDSRALVLVTEDRTWLEEATANPGRSSSAAREILSSGSGEEEEEEAAPPQLDKRKRAYGPRLRRRRRRVGLIEEVYGRQVWGAIEREDKAEWAVVSSAVVAGGTRAVRALAEAVATEVARAAMMRRSRRAFGDQAVLNYVVRRNVNVLGRKVVEQMVFVDAGGGVGGDAGVVRVVTGGTVPELGGTARYDVLVAAAGSSGELARIVGADLCSSPRESAVYSDCQQSNSSGDRDHRDQ
ncbi:hypothetical protein SELMODRAFT_444317 [Selaginella moellendorffii]|uniref:DUF7780 domain-containing protein n=1 Tax=Selaginella moellendorffii TaxID=88036 RepID=D8S8X9_SELML|nr:uncharacterized protein LOC9635537 [Selaginella moellendorffii]EFJ19110.1 hypothetical protein SELMODRAFT_444317 [Selaginella moellendorffii]|eukprot:XP_002979708.1 uncharacterized protein LOC9635537 [Selaginella moellendorffii]